MRSKKIYEKPSSVFLPLLPCDVITTSGAGETPDGDGSGVDVPETGGGSWDLPWD
ncbi:MAG: hypothetical protein IJW48_03940 [Clostridia bacterium]|nr:hypothetical protein [Clostridia bacterium]